MSEGLNGHATLMQFRVAQFENGELIMDQRNKKDTSFHDGEDTWELVSCARQDDLKAEIGRCFGDDERDHRVRIGRDGLMNSASTFEVKSWELPKLAGLVQWTADAVSLLPDIRSAEADDMGCLAVCLEDTLGRLTKRSILRLDLESPVTTALRSMVECMLEEEAMSFASDPCVDHPYRNVLLVDRWLAGYSTKIVDRIGMPFSFDEFGACPLCCRQDERLNIQRSHWFVCHAHRVCWCPGENLFSDWREESERDWQANVHRLKEYRMVEPFISAEVAP